MSSFDEIRKQTQERDATIAEERRILDASGAVDLLQELGRAAGEICVVGINTDTSFTHAVASCSFSQRAIPFVIYILVHPDKKQLVVSRSKDTSVNSISVPYNDKKQLEGAIASKYRR